MGKIKEKRNIFKKINKDTKMQWLLLVVLSLIVIIGYIIANKIIEQRLHREYTIVKDAKLVNGIENIVVESDKTSLKGYAFMSDRSSSDNLISVFLKNVATEDEIWLDMEQVDRPDVNAYFAGEHDYKNTGFIAYTESNKLDANEIYEIIINIDYDETKEGISETIRKTVSTNHYILDSNLYTYNPMEFDKPDMDVESVLLREVFANGHLCLYDKEEGIYVYQFEGKLYWVATEDFNFEENGVTYIIYHLYTSQIDKLPEYRIEHRFGNLDFFFEDKEYKDEIITPYRVAIQDIPEEYVITSIKTGVYNTEIKKTYWSRIFQLEHNFN